MDSIFAENVVPVDNHPSVTICLPNFCLPNLLAVDEATRPTTVDPLALPQPTTSVMVGTQTDIFGHQENCVLLSMKLSSGPARPDYHIRRATSILVARCASHVARRTLRVARCASHVARSTLPPPACAMVWCATRNVRWMVRLYKYKARHSLQVGTRTSYSTTHQHEVLIPRTRTSYSTVCVKFCTT